MPESCWSRPPRNGPTIRLRLASLSSLFEFLCEKISVTSWSASDCRPARMAPSPDVWPWATNPRRTLALVGTRHGPVGERQDDVRPHPGMMIKFSRRCSGGRLSYCRDRGIRDASPHSPRSFRRASAPARVQPAGQRDSGSRRCQRHDRLQRRQSWRQIRPGGLTGERRHRRNDGRRARGGETARAGGHTIARRPRGRRQSL